jgi:uncharacterized protein (DUF1778 family)
MTHFPPPLPPLALKLSRAEAHLLAEAAARSALDVPRFVLQAALQSAEKTWFSPEKPVKSITPVPGFFLP